MTARDAAASPPWSPEPTPVPTRPRSLRPTTPDDERRGGRGGLLMAGRQALAQGAWAEARRWFEAAVAEGDDPEGLEGLGEAAWWLDDAEAALAFRERAFIGYRARGDDVGAARAATHLGVDYFSLRGDPALAAGWFHRAGRVLGEAPAGPAHGWLPAWEAHVALATGKPDLARTRTGAAAEVARRLRLADLEMLAVAQEGLARVRTDDVFGGLADLDEAAVAAISGEVDEHRAVAAIYCYVAEACADVGDFERLARWDQAVGGDDEDSCAGRLWPCRGSSARALVWRGEWAEAEGQLQALAAAAGRRPLPAARAQVVLADLRLRQGRGAEAVALLDAAESGAARKLVEIPATLARAQLALDEWEPTVATELAGRVVERAPHGHHWERLRALAVLVSAHVSVAEPERAGEALVGMGVLCEAVGTEAARACLLAAEAVTAACNGDVEGHRRRLHEAVGLYQVAGAVPQAAVARLQLARALMALGRPEAAAKEAGGALRVLADLGAADADRAQTLVDGLEGRSGDDPGAAASTPSDALTPREREVLVLMAAGRSNRTIASELFLSVRTVERHVSAIYRTLGVSGKHPRADAVTAAVAAGLVTAPPPALAPAPPAEPGP